MANIFFRIIMHVILISRFLCLYSKMTLSSRLITIISLSTLSFVQLVVSSEVKPKVRWLPSTDVSPKLLLPQGNWSTHLEYIGRTSFFGGVFPGKIDFGGKENSISFMFGGEEYTKGEFEVLVFNSELNWSPVSSMAEEHLPSTSLLLRAGCSPEGQPLYICRAIQDKYSTLGAFSPGTKCSTAFDLVEQQDTHYEVLTSQNPSLIRWGTEADPGTRTCFRKYDAVRGFSVYLVGASLGLFLVLVVCGGIYIMRQRSNK